MPSEAASSKRGKKQVRINIQKAREYLEGSNQVNPKSSPLQGMKAQPLIPVLLSVAANALRSSKVLSCPQGMVLSSLARNNANDHHLHPGKKLRHRVKSQHKTFLSFYRMKHQCIIQSIFY